MAVSKKYVEIFQIDADNLRCGWCQGWLDAATFMDHAENHLEMLDELRAAAKTTITVEKREEDV